jgi:hypothetical protein
VNAYVLDPSHIAPSRSDSNSNGHFPLGNQNQSGTPRGFNLLSGLQNMQNFNAAAALAGVQRGGGNSAMQMAALLAQVNNGGMPDGSRGPGGMSGPMRRQGGNRYGTRGPYDRPGNGRDNRNARWNGGANGGGRLTPPRPGMPQGRPGAGGDLGATGAGAIPGDQRHIRSYEDLDDAGGNGPGELEY